MAEPRVEARRPVLLVVVAGTGTEVGKTWVARRLLESLRAGGYAVAARKPAHSYDPGDASTDAAELAAGSGEDPDVVCPPARHYQVPMAPPMAADALGRPAIRLADLAAEVTGSWPAEPVEVGLVELAGGVRSPMAHDGDGVDLTGLLDPDVVVLVADAGLGTIGAVRSSLDSLATLHADRRVVVHLNRFDPGDELHVRNRDWLAADAAVPAALTTSADELVAELVAELTAAPAGDVT